MPYAEGRLVHDADAHVMETPDWLLPYADPDVRERLAPIGVGVVAPGEHEGIESDLALQRNAEFRAGDAAELMLRKNWRALGATLAEDRPAALDLLGFASQLVFNTFTSGVLQRAEHDDPVLALGLARAHNRAMVEFCSVDSRLLPVGYVPLADLDRAGPAAAEALELGAAALMVASACPPGHAHSHIALDAVWARAEEAGVPVVFHVGGGGTLLDPAFFVNGLPPVPDFHGGDGNFRSVDYLAIPYPVMQALSVLVIDGVLARFPRLRIGVIEQGASWLPGLLRSLDSAHEAFRKNEERLQRLELRPSEYVLRQVRVTPYPHEDVRWVVEQAGEAVCMFSSDYPHVEGGRNPLKRFDRSLAGLGERARRRFYWDNFVDLMGPTLAATAT